MVRFAVIDAAQGTHSVVCDHSTGNFRGAFETFANLVRVEVGRPRGFVGEQFFCTDAEQFLCFLLQVVPLRIGMCQLDFDFVRGGPKIFVDFSVLFRVFFERIQLFSQ